MRFERRKDPMDALDVGRVFERREKRAMSLLKTEMKKFVDKKDPGGKITVERIKPDYPRTYSAYWWRASWRSSRFEYSLHWALDYQDGMEKFFVSIQGGSAIDGLMGCTDAKSAHKTLRLLYWTYEIRKR